MSYRTIVPSGTPSRVAVSLAARLPRLTRRLVWLWSRYYKARRREPHWLLLDLADRLDYRIFAETRLPNGLKIRVIWNDFVGRIMFRGDGWEPETIGVIRRLLKPGTIFFDLGANVGQYTLLASRLVGDQGQVHSFEPDPETFNVLQANVSANGLDNVFLNQQALSCDETTKMLYFAPHQTAGSNSMGSRPDVQSGRRIEVVCTAIDAYMRSRGLKAVDLIKMDIEGAELEALHGAECLLSAEQKPIILLEFNWKTLKAFGTTAEELARHLTERGYALLRLSETEIEPYEPRLEEPPAFNVLAVPGASYAAVHHLLRLNAEARAE